MAAVTKRLNAIDGRLNAIDSPLDRTDKLLGWMDRKVDAIIDHLNTKAERENLAPIEVLGAGWPCFKAEG